MIENRRSLEGSCNHSGAINVRGSHLEFRVKGEPNRNLVWVCNGNHKESVGPTCCYYLAWMVPNPQKPDLLSDFHLFLDSFISPN